MSKKLTCAVALTCALAVSPVHAGGLAAPQVESEVFAVQAPAVGAGALGGAGALALIAGLVLIAAVAGGGGGGGGGGW